jgi:uncharacterized membrane protein YkoI
MLVRLAFAAALVLPAPAFAIADFDRAREALERNDVLPLAAILAHVERETGARMIEVGFNDKGGRYLYEFDLVTPDGRLIEAVVDATTGRIESVTPALDD